MARDGYLNSKTIKNSGNILLGGITNYRNLSIPLDI